MTDTTETPPLDEQIAKLIKKIKPRHEYSTTEAAAACGLTYSGFKRYIFEKRIKPSRKIGVSLVFLGSDLIRFLQIPRKVGHPPGRRPGTVAKPRNGRGAPRADGANVSVAYGGHMEEIYNMDLPTWKPKAQPVEPETP